MPKDILVNDSFTDFDNTILSDHSPEVGNDWVSQDGDGVITHLNICKTYSIDLVTDESPFYTSRNLVDTTIPFEIKFELNNEYPSPSYQGSGAMDLIFDAQSGVQNYGILKIQKPDTFINQRRYFQISLPTEPGSPSASGRTFSTSGSSLNTYTLVVNDASGISLLHQGTQVFNLPATGFLTGTAIGIGRGIPFGTEISGTGYRVHGDLFDYNASSVGLEYLTLQTNIDASSGNIPLFLNGGLSTNSTIPLYIPGQFNTNTIPLYLDGVFVDNDNIPLYTSGSWPEARMNLFVKQREWIPNNSNITLYTISSSGEVNSSVPLYTQSAVSIDESGFPLFVKGVSFLKSINSGQSTPFPLYLRANEWKTTNNNISLVLPYDSGTFPSGYWNANIPLYLAQSGITVSDTLPLYLNTGLDRKNKALPLYTIHIAPTSSLNIPLYTFGIGYDSGNLPLYLHAKNFSTISASSTPLFTYGSSGSVLGYKSVKLYITASGNPNDNINLYIDGFSIPRPYNDNIALYSKGGVVVSDSGSFSLVAYNIQNTGSNNIPLYTFSTVPTVVSSSIPMYTDGHGASSSTIELYTNGF